MLGIDDAGSNVVYPQGDMHPIDKLRLSPEATTLRNYNGDGKIAILYCCVIEKKVDKKERRNDTIAVRPLSRVVSLVPDSVEDGMPKVTHEKLGDFFSWLHPLIIPPSTAPQGTIPKMKPRDLFDYALDNPTLLMSCIHGLATGWPRI